MSHIPIVDFSLSLEENPSRSKLEETGKLLYDAFSTAGFVYLKNASIKTKDVERLNHVTEEIFNASYQEKQKFAWDHKHNFGYVALNRESVDPNKPTDYKEAFNVGAEALDGDQTFCWPHHLSDTFHIVMKNFAQSCKEVAHQVLRVLAIGMELEDEEFFIKQHHLMHTSKNYTTLRSLYYPPVPDTLPLNQLRLGEHSDYGSITLLFQDNIGGLQVENMDKEFVDAVPIEGTILVNIGDALQFWTLGKLKSTKHRVLIPNDPVARKTIRRSLAYFVHPDHEVIVNKPLVYKNKVCETDKPEKLITAFQHTASKLDASYHY
nr:2-oxoglutarate-dependent dioxygenase htyE-like [Ciona intestinalis]|eukprot:XP_002119332.1 2-oxoglutarate-dependent dioxygenase htyE-like [Ciona intestinalis]